MALAPKDRSTISTNGFKKKKKRVTYGFFHMKSRQLGQLADWGVRVRYLREWHQNPPPMRGYQDIGKKSPTIARWKVRSTFLLDLVNRHPGRGSEVPRP